MNRKEEMEALADRIDRGLGLNEGHFAPPLHEREWREISAALRASAAPEEGEGVTVTIFASGDSENTPAEAVHHALAHAHKAGFIDSWTDSPPYAVPPDCRDKASCVRHGECMYPGCSAQSSTDRSTPKNQGTEK